MCLHVEKGYRLVTKRKYHNELSFLNNTYQSLNISNYLNLVNKENSLASEIVFQYKALINSTKQSTQSDTCYL